MFKPNALFLTDGYKIGHKAMLAPGTTKLYGTWIPRSVKHAPKGITKIVSFGQQMTWRWLHDEFEENFFNAVEFEYERGIDESGRPYYLPTGKVINKGIEPALKFAKDMSAYLGMEYDAKHFEALWNLGYLPIKVKSLPEGIETVPNIPHMTFVNTVDGFAWLTLYLETIVSSLAWKPSTSATLALQYRRKAVEWVTKTDPSTLWLVPFMCHDFSARGLNPHDMMSSGLGHATSFRGSDSIITIPAVRYYYGETDVCINSVNASEHSVSTTKIFTVGEQQMLSDWMKTFPTGILSVVSDTFDLWKLITEYLPALKDEIMGRDGKLVIRPDSGDPVDIICGECIWDNGKLVDFETEAYKEPKGKGVIELLWDIFGGTTNEQGYKVLDPHIGAIYGDSINLERQEQIYERLAAKGFAATNIVLGVGSFTYQYNTRDTFGFAAKGAWFEVRESRHDYLGAPVLGTKKEYDIYKDPVTDDGTKKSLKGRVAVMKSAINPGELYVKQQCNEREENEGLLQVIYEDGKFYNQTTLTQIREKLNQL